MKALPPFTVDVDDLSKKTENEKYNYALAANQQKEGRTKIGRSALLETALGGTIRQEWVDHLQKVRSETPARDTVHYDYLLVDRRRAIGTFEQFVDQIFYVGKGQNQRALDHIKKAMIVPFEDYSIQTRNIRKIMKILRTGGQLAVYVFNKNICDVVSKICEYAMIRALGLQNLTNLDYAKTEVAGEYREHLDEIGCALLHEARRIQPILMKASNWKSEEVSGVWDEEEEVMNPTSKDSRGARLHAINQKRGRGDQKSRSTSPELVPYKNRAPKKKTNKKQKRY